MMNRSFLSISAGIGFLLCLNNPFPPEMISQKVKAGSVSASSTENSFPDGMECVVQTYYRHRQDGKPGREITLNFNGPKFAGKGSIELECSGNKEIIPLNTDEGIDHFNLLLPPGAGVEAGCEARIILRSGRHELLTTVTVPAKRQWTVYIYPHSHVDIGYTNTQENVEIIHKRNLLYGIELARKTADYPEGCTLSLES